jgi:hypothetical protein
MSEASPFSIKIETDPLDSARFRWAICEGAHILVRSPNSHATREEAEKWAVDVLKRAETKHRRK